MAKEIKDILTSQTHAEFEDLKNSFKFWRAAVQGKIDGGNPLPETKVLDDLTTCEINGEKDNYLYAFPFEKVRSYRRRLRLAQSFGFSGKIIKTYVGHAARSEPIIDIKTLPQIAQDKFNKNIDGFGSNFERFYTKNWFELLSMGKVFILTDSDPLTKIPTSIILPRESVRDWSVNPLDGKLNYIIFTKTVTKIDGLERNEVNQTIGWTRENMYVGEQTKEGFKVADPVKNLIGEVPVAIADIVSPIIETVAKFDVNIMNLDSVINQILRLQAIAIPYGPKGTAKQLKSRGLGVNTFVEVPEGATPPGFGAFPANSLEAHFKYYDRQVAQILRVTNSRELSAANISGISKEWDWLDTEAILIASSNELESAFQETLRFWYLWQDSKGEFVFQVNKTEFSINQLTTQISDVLQAIGMDMGRTANNSARKSVRDAMVKAGRMQLTPTELKLSDNEIKQLEEIQEESSLEGQPVEN